MVRQQAASIQRFLSNRPSHWRMASYERLNVFEVFRQRYKRATILATTNLPFGEWTEVFGSERLTGALLDRLTHHVHIL